MVLSVGRADLVAVALVVDDLGAQAYVGVDVGAQVLLVGDLVAEAVVVQILAGVWVVGDRNANRWSCRSCREALVVQILVLKLSSKAILVRSGGRADLGAEARVVGERGVKRWSSRSCC